MLAYDVPHRAPWDFRVSLYTWTKGIAAGAYLVPALLLLAGVLPPESALWLWAAPVVGGAFLAATVGLLIARSHAPRALLPGAHAPAVAELARARRRHPLALRRGAGGALPGSPRSARAAGRRHSLWAGLPLAALSGRLHRLALRAGEGARPVAEPAAAAAAAGAGRGLRCRRAPARGRVRRARGVLRPLCALAALATLVHLLLVAGEATITPRRPRTRASPPAR